MTKKVFLSIFLSSLSTMIIAVAASCAIIGEESFEDLDKLIPAAVVIMFIVFLLAYIMAKNIVRPIKDIDPEHPVSKDSYNELMPVLTKLRKQNGRVNRYISKLTKSREQLSLITENMNEGIVVADPKTNVLSCNSAAYKLMGAEKISEGSSIYSLNNSDSFRRCIQDAMGGRRSCLIMKTDEGDRKIIASPANASDMNGGVVVFILDVTEEQALEQMRQEFTSNVSHELKTPLTTIYGISDMLANGMVKDDDVAAFGQNIRSEAERLIHLIEDIVALSKLDENAAPRQYEEVDLYALAEETIGRLSAAADEKGVSAKLIGGHVAVNGDRTILDEIIYNLCDNAIKYNRDGGKYIVRISSLPDKAIITVTDTGIGIPKEHIERIFERFYRVDKSRSRRIKGTGLGLSIVKHGVSYHNGTVRAVSSGKGAVFIVELPI